MVCDMLQYMGLYIFIKKIWVELIHINFYSARERAMCTQGCIWGKSKGLLVYFLQYIYFSFWIDKGGFNNLFKKWLKVIRIYCPGKGVTCRSLLITTRPTTGLFDLLLTSNRHAGGLIGILPLPICRGSRAYPGLWASRLWASCPWG